MDYKKELLDNRDEAYRKFSQGLLPGVKGIIGVRLPVLHKMAKKINRDKPCRDMFLKENHESFEEIMLEGFVIAEGNFSREEKLALVKNFIPKIDNWSVCDSFTAALKIEGGEAYFSLAKECLTLNKEYTCRFAYVLILNYFLSEEYKNRVMKILFSRKERFYYAKTAQAWAIQKMYSLYREDVYENLLKNRERMDRDTYLYTLQKILDSRYTSAEEKAVFRELKKDMSNCPLSR